MVANLQAVQLRDSTFWFHEKRCVELKRLRQGVAFPNKEDFPTRSTTAVQSVNHNVSKKENNSVSLLRTTATIGACTTSNRKYVRTFYAFKTKTALRQV